MFPLELITLKGIVNLKFLLIQIFMIVSTVTPLLSNANTPLNLKVPESYFANEDREQKSSAEEAGAPDQRKLIIVISNDALSGKRSDRHQTSQLKIGKITKKVPKAFQNYIKSNNYIILTLSHEIYTPEDLKSTELIEDDTPYAGWLYLTFGQMKQTNDTLSIITTDIGIVGPSAQAELFQTEFHSFSDGIIPKGWEHQLEDELGLRIEHEKRFRTPFAINSFISGELLKFYGGSLGNIRTSLKTGSTVRIGRNIPNDLGIGVSQNKSKKTSIFSFLRVQGEFVLQNIFLDGNTFKDSHSVDKRNFIAELSAGVAIMKGSFGISMTQSITTKEFDTQRGEDTNAEIRLIFDFIF